MISLPVVLASPDLLFLGLLCLSPGCQFVRLPRFRGFWNCCRPIRAHASSSGTEIFELNKLISAPAGSHCCIQFKSPLGVYMLIAVKSIKMVAPFFTLWKEAGQFKPTSEENHKPQNLQSPLLKSNANLFLHWLQQNVNKSFNTTFKQADKRCWVNKKEGVEQLSNKLT